jgi:hypothetical protein
MSKNIFDLTNMPKITKKVTYKPAAGGAKKEKSTIQMSPKKGNFPLKPAQYTEADIKKLLEGYTEVPRDQWSAALQKNDHIRYQRGDNNLFRRGGFIFSQLINAQTQKRMIQLISNPFIPISTTNRIWTIAYDDIKTIWKKQRNPPISTQSTQRASVNEDNEENSDSEAESDEKHGGEDQPVPTSQPQQNILPIQYQQPSISPSIYTQIENIKIELMRLSNEQKNIINLIKRLHNIK